MYEQPDPCKKLISLPGPGVVHQTFYIGHSDTYLHKLFFLASLIRISCILSRKIDIYNVITSKASQCQEDLSCLKNWAYFLHQLVPLQLTGGSTSQILQLSIELTNYSHYLLFSYTHGNNTKQLQTSIHNNLFTLMKMDFWINDRPQIYDYK